MLFLTACSFRNEIDSNYYCLKLKLYCIRDNKIISFKTSKGYFEVKLFGKDNPVTVSNFLENINNNIYVNQRFYKIINYSNISIIHGGVNPENRVYTDRDQTLNKNIPSLPLEMKFKEEINPRYNYQIKSPYEKENLIYTFEKGSIAMVKSGKNNSSPTEFFLLLIRFQS